MNDLAFGPHQTMGQDALTPTKCTVTVENTPVVWPLPAVVAWRWSRDLSTVVALREAFPTGNAIDQGAERLRRLKLVEALVRENGKTIWTAIRELFEELAAGKLTAVDDDLRPVPPPKFLRTYARALRGEPDRSARRWDCPREGVATLA